MRSEAPRRRASGGPSAVERAISGILRRVSAAWSMFVGDAIPWKRRTQPVPVVSLRATHRKYPVLPGERPRDSYRRMTAGFAAS